MSDIYSHVFPGPLRTGWISSSPSCSLSINNQNILETPTDILTMPFATGVNTATLCWSMGTNFFIQRMSSPKYMPCCLPASVPERQKLIVRMFCSIDSVLGLLNTYLKYPHLFLCFDIWTSSITRGKHSDSHTSTRRSWKIRDLFFLQNCFMPVSKYQVTMVTATLVNRAALLPYRSKCNTKGRQNQLWNRGQKRLGKAPQERDEGCSR